MTDFVRRPSGDRVPVVDTRPLGQRGQIQITERAAVIYAEALEVTTNDARAALLEILPGAKPKSPTREGEEIYRYRSRETGLDVSAFVRREGSVCVVESITVRGIPHRNGAGRGKSRSGPSGPSRSYADRIEAGERVIVLRLDAAHGARVDELAKRHGNASEGIRAAIRMATGG